ncbi:MAG: response regulator [Bacteroidota bacterium]
MKKILIVEDEVLLRETLVDLFDEESYQAAGVSNGREALTYLKGTTPDIIVSDIAMPEMDGIELLKIAKSEPRWQKIPFFLLTAKVSLEEKLQGLEVGADDYVTKPFDINELLLRIHNAIRLSERRAEAQSEASHPADLKMTDSFFLDALNNFLSLHFFEPDLNSEVAAKHLRLTPSGFQKKIKRLVQKPFGQYLREFRLEQARELLLSNTMNVKEVAHRVGFRRPDYFSRAFRQYFEKSPSEFLH